MAEALNTSIAALGEKIRTLKTGNGAKDEIDAAVAELLRLKGEYKTLTGTEYVGAKPARAKAEKPAKAQAEAKPAAAAAAAAATAGSSSTTAATSTTTSTTGAAAPAPAANTTTAAAAPAANAATTTAPAAAAAGPAEGEHAPREKHQPGDDKSAPPTAPSDSGKRHISEDEPARDKKDSAGARSSEQGDGEKRNPYLTASSYVAPKAQRLEPESSS
eukprot:m.32657 g.32657  ORF g.32657 m.32657 type:complete len:217 (+) comp9406_c1_seq3:50-700(+)